MKNAEYYKTVIKLITQDIIDKYDLKKKKNDGYIYVRYEKVIYSMVQSGIIPYETLQEIPNPTDMQRKESIKASGHTKKGK